MEDVEAVRALSGPSPIESPNPFETRRTPTLAEPTAAIAEEEAPVTETVDAPSSPAPTLTPTPTPTPTLAEKEAVVPGGEEAEAGASPSLFGEEGAAAATEEADGD